MLAEARQRAGRPALGLRDRGCRHPSDDAGVNNGHHRADNIIIDVNRMSEGVRQGLEMFELRECVFDNNSLPRQLTVGQLLILSQRMVTSGLVRDKDAMIGQLFVQPLVTGVSSGRDLLRDSLSCSRPAKVLQIVHRARCRCAQVTDNAFLVHNDLGLAGVSLFLAESNVPSVAGCRRDARPAVLWRQ